MPSASRSAGDSLPGVAVARTFSDHLVSYHASRPQMGPHGGEDELILPSAHEADFVSVGLFLLRPLMKSAA